MLLRPVILLAGPYARLVLVYFPMIPKDATLFVEDRTLLVQPEKRPIPASPIAREDALALPL